MGQSRLAAAAQAAVQGLHALIAELRPSSDEFRQAIDFLTEVGHYADARRQEWVLLADVLGVSSLIEDQNSPRPARGDAEHASPDPSTGRTCRRCRSAATSRATARASRWR